MTTPQNILVPTDFSPTADAARDYAVIQATAFGATLHVLHVIPDPRWTPKTIDRHRKTGH